ncbi:hypothetical protein VNO78_05884 [Psophocarpus tetragonolobus]|uniref:Late embryogenesis abundant protein LEA-2 subgroup domain-containing protein n=1 Tax=Psophocarpus tetragonolobus TaxID=3891 RepID=A0AAN9SUB1_PSOTE
MDDHKKESPLYYPLGNSMLNRTYAAATTFFAFLGEWMILFIAFSIALFFIPLTPAFTLHSASASILNITAQNNFTANLAVTFFVDIINPLGGSLNYPSFNASLFHHKQKLPTFSLQQETSTTLQAKFHNVSLTVDEWDDHHGSSSCGFAYLDLWFSVDAVRDKLQGHCGDVKFELCSSSGATNVAPSSIASCDVYSALVHKVRLGVLLLLILLLVGAAPVPLLLEQFFCFES